ncbi:DUF6461 domain-containing protein [Frankia sp. ACN1ag]|uniref:DUF6461 domain-containing protein n=1 Tax=Frankia sp. ACN1ag TaxID=102891 RepID=UPI0006DCC3AE|nr:DUF6461 domain-containing protein [Frankia sp. ACN1ag]
MVDEEQSLRRSAPGAQAEPDRAGSDRVGPGRAGPAWPDGPLGGVSGEVAQALAEVVAEVLPQLAARVPAAPAAVVGRLGAAAPFLGAARPRSAPPGQMQSFAARRQGHGGSAVVAALRALGVPVAERLLGALELAVDDLRLAPVPGLPELRLPRQVIFAERAGTGDPDGAAVRAVQRLDQALPEASAMVSTLLTVLARHPMIVPLLADADIEPAETETETEAAIAAGHGAMHLALGVAVAAAVLPTAALAPLIAGPPVIVGTGLGAAAVYLASAPMPPGYGEALLAKRRSEYRLPRSCAGSVHVRGHRFGLVEGPFPAGVDTDADAAFSANGLVTVVPGGAVIRTGQAEGTVRIRLRVLAEPPPDPDSPRPGGWNLRDWDEVVEVSWHADVGSASVVSSDGTPAAEALREQTPPWSGDYRLRVAARGRDDANRGESYELWVWPAPPAPELVRRRTDQLGHRLRREPEPPAPPEGHLRWVYSSMLAEAATITVVSGADRDDVVRAFGADPRHRRSLVSLIDLPDRAGWIAVLAVPEAGVVVVAEDNWFAGSDPATMRALSRLGPAASMFWNINAVTRLTLARDGDIVAAGELTEDYPAGPEAASYLAGIDLTSWRNRIAKGLLVVERFTGYGLRPGDLDRLWTEDLAHRISDR